MTLTSTTSWSYHSLPICNINILHNISYRCMCICLHAKMLQYSRQVSFSPASFPAIESSSTFKEGRAIADHLRGHRFGRNRRSVAEVESRRELMPQMWNNAFWRNNVFFFFLRGWFLCFWSTHSIEFCGDIFDQHLGKTPTSGRNTYIWQPVDGWSAVANFLPYLFRPTWAFASQNPKPVVTGLHIAVMENARCLPFGSQK